MRALTEQQRQENLGEPGKEVQGEPGQETMGEPRQEGRVTETSVSPTLSCSLPRGSTASEGSDLTWHIGSDIHNLESAASNYKDNMDNKDKNTFMEKTNNHLASKSFSMVITFEMYFQT